MRLQSILRAQLLCAGLAATLFLAGSVKAQEITNAEFDDGPYVVPFSQYVSLEDTPLQASAPVITESQAFKALTTVGAVNGPSIPDQLNWSQVSTVERWVTAALLVLASLLAVFILVELSLLVELKRARRNLRSSRNPLSTHAT